MNFMEMMTQCRYPHIHQRFAFNKRRLLELLIDCGSLTCKFIIHIFGEYNKFYEEEYFYNFSTKIQSLISNFKLIYLAFVIYGVKYYFFTSILTLK